MSEQAPLRRNRDFLLLWSGQAVSSLGSQMSFVAYPLLVLALTGSPAKAGLAGFARELPITLFVLPAGALADRVNRKALMITTDAVRALALGALGVAVMGGDAPFALIVIVGAIDGGGFVVTFVVERGVIRALVPSEQVGEAVARNESRLFGAMLAGPPLGGLLFALGRAVPFVIDAASYGASMLTKALIRAPFQEPRGDDPYGHVFEGVTWLWRRPFFRFVALVFACSNPVFTGLYLLIVVLAKRHGASAAEVGAMLGIAAAGGLLGSLLSPALQRRMTARFVLVAENWAIAAALALLLVVRNVLLIGVIVALAEMITPVTNSIIGALRIQLAPDRLQGRVQAASSLISFAVGWAGPLVVGLLLQDAGATVTILALTGWMTALAIAASTSRAVRAPPTPTC